MKRIVLALLVCLQPFLVFAHPGKTDRYGGHRCLKGCEAWELQYGEYHLHDKDGKPIRVSQHKKGGTAEPVLIEPIRTPETTVVQIDPPQTQVVMTSRHVANISEENGCLSNPFLTILLILLVLLLFLRMNRKRGET